MVSRAIYILTITCAAAMCVSHAGAQSTAPPDSQPAHAPSAVGAPVRPLTLGEKATLYTDRTFSVRTVLGASFAAGLAQWRRDPREWGAGISGYGRRDAAAYGGGLIRNTAEFSVGALLREDPRFEPSAHNGFVARAADALHNTLFVRTDDGGHQLAWSRAAAAVATGFAVNSWEPRRLHSTHHAIVLSLGGFASYGTGNLMHEFGPDIKRFLFHKLRIDDRM